MNDFAISSPVESGEGSHTDTPGDSSDHVPRQTAMPSPTGGTLNQIDEHDQEILLYISLPNRTLESLDLSSAYVDRQIDRQIDRQQEFLVVHLPRHKEPAPQTEAMNDDHGPGTYPHILQPSGEGYPAGKLGDHYRPSSSEDHISKQQEIESKTDARK